MHRIRDLDLPRRAPGAEVSSIDGREGGVDQSRYQVVLLVVPDYSEAAIEPCVSCTLTYSVPGISTGHCRAAIADEVGAFAGVGPLITDDETTTKETLQMKNRVIESAPTAGYVGAAGSTRKRS
jgi:hypothetical protein